MSSNAGDSRDQTSRSDETRARLLDAAVAAFSEKGFHGTTTRDIAATAGMSPAALYVHHKTKEELLFLISKDGHEDTLRLMRAAIGSSDEPGASLRRLIHDFAVHHARGRTSARIVNYELAALTPEHRAEIRNIRSQIEEEMHALVERGVAAGVFNTPDPRMATVALLSLGIDIARWYREGAGWSPEDVGNHYADIAVRIMGVKERPTGRGRRLHGDGLPLQPNR
jgi:AcrR family transcriptional regulator